MEEDILEQAKEDHRVEQVMNFLKKYANHLISGVIGFFVLVGVIIYIQHHRESALEKSAELYEAAWDAAQSAQAGKASDLLDQVEKEGTASYPWIARFKKAGLYTTSAADRVAIYEALSTDSSVDVIYRELAVILGASNALETGDPAVWIKKLETLALKRSVWELSARELMLRFAARAGDQARVKQEREILLKDNRLPATMRARLESF